jgi:hypothetical protein
LLPTRFVSWTFASDWACSTFNRLLELGTTAQILANMASDPPEDAIANFVSFTSTTREQAINFLKVRCLGIPLPPQRLTFPI